MGKVLVKELVEKYKDYDLDEDKMLSIYVDEGASVTPDTEVFLYHSDSLFDDGGYRKPEANDLLKGKRVFGDTGIVVEFVKAMHEFMDPPPSLEQQVKALLYWDEKGAYLDFPEIAKL